MGQTASPKSTLSPRETLVFFAAMLLIITLEGACVDWLGVSRVPPSRAGIHPANLAGQWTGASPPQCWALGALLVLFYLVSTLLVPPQNWSRTEVQSNRRYFVRLWCWTVALGTLQLSTLYLDRFTIGVH
jgi:hypothetical protein